jgi:hypothetical protein
MCEQMGRNKLNLLAILERRGGGYDKADGKQPDHPPQLSPTSKACWHEEGREASCMAVSCQQWEDSAVIPKMNG